MEKEFAPFQSVRRFYFLEYFYVLLKSIEKYSNKNEAFELFKELKQLHQLGESKYKKLTAEPQKLSKVQLDRYKYTFSQVIEESNEYNLIDVNESVIKLRDEGKNVIELYENENKSNQDFHEKLFKLMEDKYNAFNMLIQFLNDTNTYHRGLIVFPSYSPRQLLFDKNEIKLISHYQKYLLKLREQLESDILKYIGISRDLSEPLKVLLDKLDESKLLSKDSSLLFPHTFYNVITKRVRDFWISYFLKDIYKFHTSYNAFEIWIYRAKQIGIINATDFYPNFNGRIVYPTSVIANPIRMQDFKSIYKYSDGKQLLLHIPSGEDAENKYAEYLVNNYFHLRNQSNNYFVKLSSLRELVCYNMKISETTFELLLNSVYRRNLSGELQIKISLEVDKLPEDAKSMYLKRTPLMVDGKYRNIIAIDIGKERRAK